MQILRDYMVTPVLSVSVETKVQEAAQIMAEKKFSSLLVKQGESYVGILTTTDITYRMAAKGLDPKTTPVGDILSKPLIGMDFMLTLEEAFEKMRRKKIERLAVYQGDEVVGIISIKDLMRVTGG